MPGIYNKKVFNNYLKVKKWSALEAPRFGFIAFSKKFQMYWVLTKDLAHFCNSEQKFLCCIFVYSPLNKCLGLFTRILMFNIANNNLLVASLIQKLGVEFLVMPRIIL